jgi:transcriptional regulator with XRE-family HTH domain
MTIAELRRVRMAQGLSLTEISRRTRIGVGYLRKIEEGQLDALPPGFYARAFVRAYAEAMGAEADAVLASLADQLPSAQPAQAHAAQSGSASPAGGADAADARTAVLRQLLERHDALAHRAADHQVPEPADTRRPIRQLLAATLDGLLMGGLYAGVLALTAYACGVGIAELVRLSGVAVFTVLGLITVLYVVMMGGIAGRTIGAMLLDVPTGDEPPAPLQLRAILHRSLHCLRPDASAARQVVSMITRARRAA